jgi:DNA-binding SARP family transcriptional activator
MARPALLLPSAGEEGVVDFGILGPLEVWDEGNQVKLGGAKQRALLAVLLLSPRVAVSDDRLIDDLWGDEPPATAAHTIQVYVSNLRKVLGAARLVRRPPGYALDVAPDELDLERFERVATAGRTALGEGRPEEASRLLGEAIAVWRGEPLADFAFEPFAQTAIGRLDELRVSAFEGRIEADLACGRHGELVGELESLVREHPLREGLRGYLMLALYRAGRQAEALAAYQEARRALVDDLGIDPGPALQRLERAILAQDPALDAAPATAPGSAAAPAQAGAPDRSILLSATNDLDLDALISIAEPLARSSHAHELILTSVASPSDLRAATKGLQERRTALVDRGTAARSAAFTSQQSGEDVARLAVEQDVDLVLLGMASGSVVLDDRATLVIANAPCDVALAYGLDRDVPGGTVVAPFGGSQNDWAGLELAAWLAAARNESLRLLGTTGDEDGGQRDASRLLAHAALAVQQLAGVETEPELAPPGPSALLAAAAGASVLVVGLPDGWRAAGVGELREQVALGATCPVLFVSRGPRPGGLAPRMSLTRFTWSLGGG